MVFLFMFPFFIISGFFFLFISLFFSMLKFSILFNWSFFYCSFIVSFPFYFDFMSCIFMSVVLLISGSIFFYSEFYMMEDKNKSRFFYLMFLFVLSMLFLIICPNLFCMLLGWDGLGVVSYCLVIYYQNYSSFCSGMITALTNRIGDVFILSSMGLFFCVGSWSYMNFLYMDLSNFLIVFFIIASMTKSAQIPFSAWLPAAMAAPTPVSSLVHSSTLVTAGVYILIRFNFFLDGFKFYLIVASLCTMIMAGLSGMLETDLKKVIALSTLSQLGFMVSTLCIGMPDLAFFHLVTHAFFKALLFMCAGMFIHMFFDNQDIRGFGLLTKDYSLALCMFSVANLSLCGFPFLSGFFSKDLILELLIMKSSNFFFFFLFMVGTCLTVMYSFRLFLCLTFKKSFFLSSVQSCYHSVMIYFSMVVLFFFSIFFGFYFSFLLIYPFNFISLPIFLKMFIFLICVLSFLTSFVLSKFYSFFLNYFIFFLSSMWFLGFLKTDFSKLKFLSFCYKISKSSVGFIEFFLGLKNVSFFFGYSYLFSGVLKNFFFIFFFFSFMFFFCLVMIIL